MSSERKLVQCVECGDEKPHAGHGLCFACYQRNVRERNANYKVPGVRKEQTAIIKAYGKILDGLEKLKAGEEEVNLIKRVLRPYLKLADSLLRAEDPDLPADDQAVEFKSPVVDAVALSDTAISNSEQQSVVNVNGSGGSDWQGSGTQATARLDRRLLGQGGGQS